MRLHTGRAGAERPSIGKHESEKSIRRSSYLHSLRTRQETDSSHYRRVLPACCVVHQEPDKIGSRRARINHSSRNSEKLASAAADFATTTTSQPGAIIVRCSRQISRNLRRTRLRITAPPTRREVTRPNRVPPPAGSRAALKRKSRPCTERPSERTRQNSRPNRMRAARGNRSLSGLGMPGVGDFDTLGQQAFASTLAATAEDGAPALGLHPSAKAELPLARALAWLIGAFHRFGKNWSQTGYAFDSLSQSTKTNSRKARKERKEFPAFQHFPTLLRPLPSYFLLLTFLTAVVSRRFGKVRQNRSSEARGKDRSPLPTAK